MARVHLIIGPVGAGKSTYAKQLCRDQRALSLNLDDWLARLFRPDRPETNVMPWYLERVERCKAQIWCVTQSALSAGTSVVLEIGLIRAAERRAFYEWVDRDGVELDITWVHAPRDLRRERVAERNRRRGETFSMEVPLQIFELASDLWEAPSEGECRERGITRWSETAGPRHER